MTDMFTPKTQKERVKDRLAEVGYVDNFWAIKNYMLRLGAIIAELKREGYKFYTGWGAGSEKKNYHYYSVEHVQKDLLGYSKKKT